MRLDEPVSGVSGTRLCERASGEGANPRDFGNPWDLGGHCREFPTATRILSVPIDFVGYDDVLAMVETWRQKGERHYVCLTNPHSIMLCRRDDEMRAATVGATLALPDGVGTVMAGALLGHKTQGRITGPTLLLRFCDHGRRYGCRHFFYGGEPFVAEQLAERLRGHFPGLEVAGTYCPPFRPLSQKEDVQVVEMINATKPDIVWVGLGAPKQEKWMAAHQGKIQAAAMIGVGAAFDFHSHNKKWAPVWFRRMGCEWMFRLLVEPKRMWRRNVNNILFVALVLGQRRF